VEKWTKGLLFRDKVSEETDRAPKRGVEGKGGKEAEASSQAVKDAEDSFRGERRERILFPRVFVCFSVLTDEFNQKKKIQTKVGRK
jgi:hypothetical protein